MTLHRPAPGADRGPGQGRGLRPVRPDRAAVTPAATGGYTRIVQDRSPQGLTPRPMATHRAGRGAVCRAARSRPPRPQKAARKAAAQQDKVAALAREDELARRGRRPCDDGNGRGRRQAPTTTTKRGQPGRCRRSGRRALVAWEVSSGDRVQRHGWTSPYDGTDFSAGRRSRPRRTVAGVLAGGAGAGLRRGTWPPGSTVAGRTDAGVHATGQVCARRPARPGAGHELARHRCAGWPRLLPRRRAGAALRREVPAELRRPLLGDCSGGTSTGSPTRPGAPTPLRRHDTAGLAAARSTWTRLNAAAAGLARRARLRRVLPAQGRTPPRSRGDPRLDWRRDPDGVLVATVQADAFCQAMVRSLVGAMLVAGDGRRAAVVAGRACSRRRERSSGDGGAARTG